mgnify:CR=1 FL=1
MLDMTLRELEKALYFEAYIVIDGTLTDKEGEEEYKKGQLLSEDAYQKAIEEYGADLKVGMGAEAIKELLNEIELKKTFEELKDEFDINVPKNGHENRFLEKLNADKVVINDVEKSRFNWKPLLAVAASLVICFSVFIT